MELTIYGFRDAPIGTLGLEAFPPLPPGFLCALRTQYHFSPALGPHSIVPVYSYYLQPTPCLYVYRI